MRKTSWGLFALMVSVWGSNWAVMKIGLQFIDPLNFVAHRLLFASAALLPTLIWRREDLPRDGYTWLKLIVLSLINAVGMTATNAGLSYEPTGLSSLLTYTQPLFVFCLSIVFLNEEVNAIKVLGVVSGFLGVVILYAGRPLSKTILLGPFLSLLLGAFLWALTVVYYKRLLIHVEPLIANIVQFSVGSLFLFILAFIRGGPLFSYNALYIFSVLYVSVLGSALASTIWLFLIREEETIIVSTSSLMVPVIAALIGWLFLGENIGYNFVLSIIFVLTGLYLVNMRRRAAPTTAKPIVSQRL